MTFAILGLGYLSITFATYIHLPAIFINYFSKQLSNIPLYNCTIRSLTFHQLLGVKGISISSQSF